MNPTPASAMAEPAIVIAPVDVLIERCAGVVLSCAREGMAQNGRWSLAISGGSVGERLLPGLVRRGDVPWAACDVFWIDERAVPVESADSNYGSVASLWASHAPTARLHPMPINPPDLELAASVYAGELRSVLGDPPRFDVVVSGIGEDGHIASLFPGGDDGRQATRTTLAVADSPKPPSRRLSVTFPLLSGARHVVIAAFGRAKSAIIAEALRQPSPTLPVARVVRESARATILLDLEAGAQLASSRNG